MLARFSRFIRRTHRIRLAARKAQRGMTLLEIMIVLAILALVMGLVVGPRVMKMFGESKEKIAAMAVQKYAYEAYPQWSAAHPSMACPNGLLDLNEYTNAKDLKDPWGNDFKMYCGQQLPPGAKGIAVLSFGPDGKEGTPDDIKSWE